MPTKNPKAPSPASSGWCWGCACFRGTGQQITMIWPLFSNISRNIWHVYEPIASPFSQSKETSRVFKCVLIGTSAYMSCTLHNYLVVAFSNIFFILYPSFRKIVFTAECNQVIMDTPMEESDWPDSSSDDTSSSYHSIDNINLSSEPGFPFSLFSIFRRGMSKVGLRIMTLLYIWDWYVLSQKEKHTDSMNAEKGRHNAQLQQ
jgi:hypothetical protein